MTPSLPIELPIGTCIISVVDPFPCGMLRFGLPCSNDAYIVLVCPASGADHRLIGVCQMCVDDADGEHSTGKTWIQELEDLVVRGQSSVKIIRPRVKVGTGQPV